MLPVNKTLQTRIISVTPTFMLISFHATTIRQDVTRADQRKKNA